MPGRILICTDLDRTLIPNGPQVADKAAHQKFVNLVAHPEIELAYVSGRNKSLVLDAIDEYRLPNPDYVIADVGTTIYSVETSDATQWHLWDSWQDEIASNWHGYSHDQLAEWLLDIAGLRLQEKEKQSPYKLSYYVTSDKINKSYIDSIEAVLKSKDVAASIIYSINEVSDTGLIDILPENATKLHAIEFLMKHQGYSYADTVYSGDSGNDLPVLTSRIDSVLVNNATQEVKSMAIEMALANGTSDHLYIASGETLASNGYYSAGILEGILHYHPELNVVVSHA